MLRMICTKEGYAITDEHGTTFASFSVAAGQPIFMDAYRDPKQPDVTSIFLRGVLAAYRAFSPKPVTPEEAPSSNFGFGTRN